MNHTFSIRQSIDFGWQTFKKNYKFWLIAGIFGMSVGFMSGARTNTSGFSYQQNVQMTNDGTAVVNNTSVASSLATAILFIFAMPYMIAIVLFSIFASLVLMSLSMGFTKLTLNAVRNEALRYETLLSIIDLRKSFRLIVAIILYMILIIVGTALFIIPGIYWAVKYQFFGYGIVDKGYGVLESFRCSAQLTKGVKFKLVGYNLVCVAMCFIGFFALYIGGFFAAIVISLASAYIYETLRKQLASPDSSPVIG